MFKLFKRNNLTKKIQQWAGLISQLINSNAELKAKIDQVGILDGQIKVNEFIESNELGLAYKHLIYMISESGIYLTEEQINDITELAGKLELSAPTLYTPSAIETDEFYIVLASFNKAQKKVINHLKDLWKMITPMTGDQWIVWSQDQYEEDEFTNDQNIKIFPHGFGLSYKDEELFVDFDFGEQGESTGFDVNRLWLFIERNKIKTVFTNMKQIKKVVDFEVASGRLEFSGYVNYYKK
ncbi:MAG: hypothetical protein AAFQ94_18395 [Bacteroidota bacterium]